MSIFEWVSIQFVSTSLIEMVRAKVIFLVVGALAFIDRGLGTSIKVEIGGEFTVTVTPDPDCETPVMCGLYQNDATQNLYALNSMNTSRIRIITKKYHVNFFIVPGDQCSVKVQNISKWSQGTWELVAFIPKEKMKIEFLTVKVLEPDR